MEQWEIKAHRLIADLAKQAYLSAGNTLPINPRKKHKLYTLPTLAISLVAILGYHDRQRAENEAKALFLAYNVGLHPDSDLNVV